MAQKDSSSRMCSLKFIVTVSKRAEAEEFRRPTETIAASKIEMNRRPVTLRDLSRSAKNRTVSLMSSNGDQAPLLASLWRETMCGCCCCVCIKKQINYQRQLNTSAPNSSSRHVFFHWLLLPNEAKHVCFRRPQTQTSDPCFSSCWNANPMTSKLSHRQRLWIQPFVCCQRRLGCKCREGGGGRWDSHKPNDSCPRFH